MVFRKRKERTDRSLNELRLGEFWLMSGEFRAEEATAGMTGSYGLPGGYGALAASAEQEEALRPFHAIVQRTVEEVSAGLPVALTVSDYTGHTCALWEARFPELRQMALEQCRWFKEEEVGKGERHIFLFDRLPAAQRIVYIALSVYPYGDSLGGRLSELFYSEKRVSSSF